MAFASVSHKANISSNYVLGDNSIYDPPNKQNNDYLYLKNNDSKRTSSTNVNVSVIDLPEQTIQKNPDSLATPNHNSKDFERLSKRRKYIIIVSSIISIVGAVAGLIANINKFQNYN